MRDSYEDIIDLPHQKSSKHPHMPRCNRAAQFSPFAALKGYDAAIREAARITYKKAELDEYVKAHINEKLCILQEYIEDKAEVSIVYFQEDNFKKGGSNLTAFGYLVKIDEHKKTLVMEDGKEISIEDIIEIDCQLFNKIYL